MIFTQTVFALLHCPLHSACTDSKAVAGASSMILDAVHSKLLLCSGAHTEAELDNSQATSNKTRVPVSNPGCNCVSNNQMKALTAVQKSTW